MKIRKVRFKNLNSLLGEWQIDFTNHAYLENGIFAITGPTGAGKTTILDAICLALYGKTPRLERLTKNENEIMSRKTGECFAEVIFETPKGTYCAHWSQRRARNKPDQALQEAKHELTDMVTNKPLNTKKKAVAEDIKEITGMDFAQFTRTILLAQGSFSRFLKSSADERSPILEKITGTAIYTEISKLVQDRNREESIKLHELNEQLAKVTLLTPDEIKEKKALLKQQETALVTLEKQQQDNQVYLNWYENLSIYQKQIATLGEEKQRAEQAKVDFQGNAVRLARANVAAKLMPQALEIQTLRFAQKEDEDKQQALKQANQTISDELNKIADDLQKTQSAVNQFVQEEKDSTPIWEAVKALDSQIAVQSVEYRQAQETKDKSLDSFSDKNAQLTSADSAINDANMKLESAKRYLMIHAGDEALADDLPALEEKYGQIKGMQEELEELDKRLRKVDRKIENQEEDLTKAQEKQAKHQSKEALITQAINQVKEQITAYEKQHTRQFLKERLALLNERQTFEARVASLEAHRAALKPGEACPCCGAIDHPFVTKQFISQASEIANDIKQVQASIDQFEQFDEELKAHNEKLKPVQEKCSSSRTQVMTAQTELSQTKVQKQTLLGDINTKEKQLTTNQRRFTKALNQFLTLDEQEDDVELNLSMLKARRLLWNKQLGNKQTFDEKLKGVKLRKEELQKEVAQLEVRMHEDSKVLQQKKQTLEKSRQSRTELFGNRDPEQARQTLAEKIQLARDEKGRLDVKQSQKKTQQEENQKQQIMLQNQIDARKQLLQTKGVSFSQALAKNGFTSEADYVQACLSEEAREDLQKQADSLAKACQTVDARIQENQSLLKSEQAKALTTLTEQEVREAGDALVQQKAPLVDACSNLRTALALDEQNRVSSQRIRTERDGQQAIADVWANLNNLIGSSDGKKYRNFAQGLTFSVMIAYANQQLQKMTDRYLLQQNMSEQLELNVVDRYQANEVRSTKNLSGGESFIVSLALALGLSQMASKNVRVDSLFLDEGFGTLDELSLETALDTLASLHDEGKLIGVISHVPALKERIPTQIQVTPNRKGRSVISGPGCQLL